MNKREARALGRAVGAALALLELANYTDDERERSVSYSLQGASDGDLEMVEQYEGYKPSFSRDDLAQAVVERDRADRAMAGGGTLRAEQRRFTEGLDRTHQRFRHGLVEAYTAGVREYARGVIGADYYARLPRPGAPSAWRRYRKYLAS